MGNYTEQELLLLSNFAYIPACLSDEPIGKIIDSYREADGGFTERSVYAAAAGGGMSTQEVAAVFGEMDKRIQENPQFGELSASRRLEEADVRAICYTDPKDKKPVVVFRGTGGTPEAWSDNFEGAYVEDTRIQKVADDFVKYECGIYDGIVVTGHSKGGNMAQYVTVKNREMISSCVSFDGQGFGDDFIAENSEAIAAAAPRIKSVSAYNDFVNILLTGIAGTCIYVENEPSAKAAHSSVTLLTENTFDRYGNFASIRQRGAVSAILDAFTDRMCDKLEPLDIREKEKLARAAGSTISGMLCTPSDRMMTDVAAPLLGVCAGEFIKTVTAAASVPIAEQRIAARYAGIDIDACKSAVRTLSDQVSAMDQTACRIDSVRRSLAYTISSKICAEHRLDSICDDILRLEKVIDTYSGTVSRILGMYEMCETEAASIAVL